jgi:tRNA A37 threonylcarbamoyladenosine dehydratase
MMKMSSEDRYTRTRILIGDKGIERLEKSRVAVFGLGGVGGFTVEALARAGVGSLDIIDNDTVDITNLNRQIIATLDTVGRQKTAVMEERIHSIDPGISVVRHDMFFLPENSADLDFSEYDYVVDAVDTVTAKIEIAVKAEKEGCRLISCMGTGNKMDPSRLMITDISKTHMCRLAKVMRHELRVRGITHLKVLFSDEEPLRSEPPGSISFVPSAAGLMIAGEVIRELIDWKK